MADSTKSNDPKHISPDLVILHSNDIHGHLTSWTMWEGPNKGRSQGGMDRVASLVKDTRRQHGPKVLVLDAGDTLSDSMIADLSEGQAMVEVLDAIGYDALTLGNHEVDFGRNTIEAWASRVSFPLLAANLSGPAQNSVKPYTIKNVGPYRIGILGLTYPKTPLTTGKSKVTGLVYSDPIAAARDQVKELRRAGVDLIIALTHLGLKAEMELARQVPEINIIVGGHSHNRMEEPIRQGNTLIAQAGAHASDMGRFDLWMADKGLKKSEHKLIPLDETIKADPDIKLHIAKWMDKFRSQLDAPVGTASRWLIRAQTLAGPTPEKREEESPVDLLFADIIRSETRSDIALLPGVGYGIGIPPGPIRASSLRQLIPHESKVVTMHLKGKHLRATIERSLDNVYSQDLDQKVGGMIQTSGLTAEYDPKAPSGSRLRNFCVGGKPLVDAHSYLIATNSMLAEGGHSYSALTKGTKQNTVKAQYDLIANWMATHPGISAPEPGRIKKLSIPHQEAHSCSVAPSHSF